MFVDRDADVGKAGAAQCVREVEIGHRIDMAMRRVMPVIIELQRPEHVEEAKEKVTQPRAQIEHVRSADDEDASRSQHTRHVTQRRPMMLEVLDDFRARHQVKRPVGIGQRLDVEVRYVHRNAFDGEEITTVVTRACLHRKRSHHTIDQLAVARADIEVVAVDTRRDFADFVDHGPQNSSRAKAFGRHTRHRRLATGTGGSVRCFALSTSFGASILGGRAYKHQQSCPHETETSWRRRGSFSVTIEIKTRAIRRTAPNWRFPVCAGLKLLKNNMTRSIFSRGASALLSLAAFGLLSATAAAQTPTPTPVATPPSFTKIIVFGDSLSDVGNLRDRMEDKGFNYPGGEYNYSDGRFTNSSDTDPASSLYVGVWHEQLSRTFLNLPRATHSQDGGDAFAFGGATTRNGTSDYSIVGIFGNDITVTIDNLGKQVDDYLASRVIDPAALYVVWGGGNDFIDDDTSTNVTATAGRMAMLVSRLANAGARNFLVPNVPPIGGLPRFEDDRETQDDKNGASADYRMQLDANLNSTMDALVGQGVTNAVIHRLDVWDLFIRFAVDPTTFGFTDTRNSAQGRRCRRRQACLLG